MIQNILQKKPKLSYSKDVFDIVLYGSALTALAPNDIDIAVIFYKIPLSDQLSQAQNIKKQLRAKTEIPIHIKSFDLYSFFDPGNFAKENILTTGKSLILDKYFAENFNLIPRLQIAYSLKNLQKKEKVRFHYLLNGKNKSSGLLNKYNGKLLSPGLIEISPESKNIFIESIKEITSEYKLVAILKYIP